MRRGNFLGKGSPIVKYRDFLPWALQKRLNQSICHLRYGLERAEGSTSSNVLRYSPGGANLPRWEGTFAPRQQEHVGSKTLLQQNHPDVNCWCRLTVIRRQPLLLLLRYYYYDYYYYYDDTTTTLPPQPLLPPPAPFVLPHLLVAFAMTSCRVSLYFCFLMSVTGKYSGELPQHRFQQPKRS